jgi:hypothetical protein
MDGLSDFIDKETKSEGQGVVWSDLIDLREAQADVPGDIHQKQSDLSGHVRDIV